MENERKWFLESGVFKDCLESETDNEKGNASNYLTVLIVIRYLLISNVHTVFYRDLLSCWKGRSHAINIRK